MRGIVFIGGEGPPPGIARDLAGEAGLVAAADSGLTAAEEAGLRPDWIIGDMDSLGDVSRLDSYPKDRVIRCLHEKDYTDTELGLSLLREKGCDEVWIAGGGGGRIDHLFALRALFERDLFPARWITARDDIRALEAPGELKTRRFPEGAIIAVSPLGNGPWEARSRGLKWPLDNVRWDRGFFGASNEATGDDIEVKLIRGRFMVLLPLREEYVCDNH
ncbi:MAG: thiamine diphosphokinase [Treponema sp.]|jgi:thiamine pyrophosphokinase|nr:thiamine diphosphokinase [Treponema sp.]